VRKVREHAKRGKWREAMALVQEKLLSAASGRERCFWLLHLAGLCLENRKPEFSMPILAQIAEEFEAHRLEGWESRGFSTRVWSVLYRSYRRWNGDGRNLDQKVAEAREHLCRIDPTADALFEENGASP